MKSWLIRAGKGRHMVHLRAVVLGEDLCLCFGGGGASHIGAVALATPRPSLRDAAKTSASASVLCVTGHKDDMLARSLALRAAACLERQVAATVGLHLDDASAEDIAALCRNATTALEKGLKKMRSLPSE